MWSAPVIIYEGEDEAALKAKFVDLCARYPHVLYSDIGVQTFKHLPDAYTRGNQAGLVWSTDLEILEAIREAKLISARDPKTDGLKTKEQRILELETLATNALQAKDRIAAYKLIAEMQGEVIKAVNKKVENTGQGLPTYIFKRYSDLDCEADDA